MLCVAGPPPEKPAATELGKLQGTWQVTSAEAGGRAVPGGKGCTLRIEGDKTTLDMGDGHALTGTVRIDPKAKPKAMDLIYGQGVALPAVYELDGNVLKICQALPGEDRPAAVSGKAGGAVLTVYKRVKP